MLYSFGRKDYPEIIWEDLIHAQKLYNMKQRAPKAFTMIRASTYDPAVDYQSLQAGFLSGHWKASLNSRELAMVSCTRY